MTAAIPHPEPVLPVSTAAAGPSAEPSAASARLGSLRRGSLRLGSLRLGSLLLGAPRLWSPRARLAGFAMVGVLGAAAAVRVYLVDPAQSGHYPTCPFRWATSFDCPGCGTLRGLHELLHGHPGAAANYNLFLVVVAPMLVLGWAVAVARAAGWRRCLPRVPARLLPAVPVLVIAFWVLRNLPLPGCTWLASQPG